MNIKEVKEMPVKGQFVAVWEHGGKLFCNSYLWEDNVLTMYVDELGDFISDQGSPMDLIGDITGKFTFFII